MDNMKIPDRKTIEQAMRFAQSPEGQRLIASLQRSSNPNLSGSADVTGDQEMLRQRMQSLLSSPQIQQLMKQLGENHG